MSFILEMLRIYLYVMVGQCPGNEDQSEKVVKERYSHAQCLLS